MWKTLARDYMGGAIAAMVVAAVPTGCTGSATQGFVDDLY